MEERCGGGRDLSCRDVRERAGLGYSSHYTNVAPAARFTQRLKELIESGYSLASLASLVDVASTRAPEPEGVEVTHVLWLLREPAIPLLDAAVMCAGQNGAIVVVILPVIVTVLLVVLLVVTIATLLAGIWLILHIWG